MTRPSVASSPALAILLSVALATAVSATLSRVLDLANLAMVYLLAVVSVAVRHGRAASFATTLISLGLFNFLFVPPRWTLRVSDVRHLFTFCVMFVVAIIITNLTERIRSQAAAARVHGERATALYGLTRELARSQRTAEIVSAALQSFQRAFRGRFVILLPDAGKGLSVAAGNYEMQASELDAARWTLAHTEPAGAGTRAVPQARALYLPLSSGEQTFGVLGMLAEDPRQIDEPEERQLLSAFCKQTAMALERAHFGEEAQTAALRAETESFRNTLLSSVSHDLRTPLGAIAGAATALLEEPPIPRPLARELLLTIVEESTRLGRLVTNLLDMTRLDSGGIAPKKEWIPLEEVIGAALNRTEELLGDRDVTVAIAPEAALLEADAALMEQVFINVLENAAKYTPEGSPLAISCGIDGASAVIEIRDQGSGLIPGTEDRIFEKFFRSARPGQKGTGLGLAISRGVVRAHGGEMRAFNHREGGAVFEIRLPAGSPPASTTEEEWSS